MPTRLIIVIVMLAIALILGFVLTWPKYQDFRQVVETFNQKNEELSSKTQYYSKIKEIWGKLEGYEDVLPKVDVALPDNYSVPALFHYLQQTTGESGLILEDLTFEGISGEKVKEVGITLQASGSYAALKSFLSSLESSDRFFKTKSVSFSFPEEENEPFSFDFGITAYSY